MKQLKGMLIVLVSMLSGLATLQASAQDSVTQSTTTQVAMTAATVNINTADLQALQTLNGVGPRTAQAIIDWREQEGPFVMTEQLMAVSGIGEKTYARLREQVTVE